MSISVILYGAHYCSQQLEKHVLFTVIRPHTVNVLLLLV